MAQIIIEIPDEMAQRLAPFQSQFSDLFTSLIATRLLAQPIPDSATPAADPNTSNTYQEILDFLIDQPTSAQIINFKVSIASQLRLQTLLHKNNEIALNASETVIKVPTSPASIRSPPRTLTSKPEESQKRIKHI
jgi:hypothetical protein